MEVLTRPPRQVAGGTPLDLALLLERSGVRLVAPARALAPGLELLEFVASFDGARPATAASCRERPCRADLLRLRVDPAALLGWVTRRITGAGLPGWRVEHVAWDMLEGTGDGAAWILRGVADSGAAVWLRIELQLRMTGGRITVGARRCWLLGPPTLDCGRIWRALLRRLGRGPGLGVRDEGLVIDVARASLGAAFAAAGWRLPEVAGLRCRVEPRPDALLLHLGPGAGAVSWPEGQVDVRRPEDPLAQVRGWLRGGPAARERAEGALRELAAGHPAVAATLLRALALALRFVARDRCVAAVEEWLRVAPEDGEARWLLAVQHASRGDSAGLLAALRGVPQGVPQRLAQALVLQRVAGGAAEARALLEPLVPGLQGCAAELQAAVWRALARSRAGDRSTPAIAVLAAVEAALGEDGWRRREEAGELRAQVAAAVVASGRPEAETTPLLRRLLGDVRPGRWDRPAPPVEPAVGRAVRRERGEGRASTRLVSEYLAQEGRWSELVTVLERQLLRLGGVTRIQALRRIARIHRHHLHDAVRAEQALRAAIEDAGEDAAMQAELGALRAELVTCLEMQGRGEAAQEVLRGGEDVLSDRSDGGAVGAVEDGFGDGAEVVEGEGAVAGAVIEDVSGDRPEVVEGEGVVVSAVVEDVPGDRPVVVEHEAAQEVLRPVEDVSGDRPETVEGEGAVGGAVVEDVSGDRPEMVEHQGAVGGAVVEDVSRDRLGGGASDAVETRVRALSARLAGLGAGEAAEFAGLLADTRALAEELLAGGDPARARPWLQLAAFLAPQAVEAVETWPAKVTPEALWSAEVEPEADAREALRAALRALADELAGIRAPGAVPAVVPGSPGAAALAVAEAELGPLRAALGLALPLRPGAGEVGVRNERPPAIGVGAAFAGLSPGERRFRLAFAAVMIGGGLAIVTDPQGASLPELLAALQHLADATCPLRLPGAQAIVRALAARGVTGERLPAALREALALELEGWQQSRVSVTRLAQLLRRDHLQAALRLSGTLEGALRTIGRDARLTGSPEEQALQVLASADGQGLLRAAGLLE